MTVQLMDQLLTNSAQNTQSAQSAQSTQSAGAPSQDRPDFGAMVRQKKQEVQGGSERPEKTRVESRTAAGDDAVEEETVVVEDQQYVFAAALLFQMQPNVHYVEAQEAVAETTEPVEAPVVVHEVSEEARALPQDLSGEGEREDELPVPEEDAHEFTLPELEREAVREPDAPVREVTEEAPEARVERVTERTAEAVEEVAVEEEDEEIVAAEAPVFGEVEAVPVQVSQVKQSETPVALEQEDAAEELSEQIKPLLSSDAAEESVEITLVPASLGSVTVTVTHTQSGELHILMTVVSERAAALLERNANGLQNLLSTYGRSQIRVEVNETEPARQPVLDPNAGNRQSREQQQEQQQRQQQQQQQQEQQDEQRERRPYETRDFIQQLRLGLTML